MATSFLFHPRCHRKFFHIHRSARQQVHASPLLVLLRLVDPFPTEQERLGPTKKVRVLQTQFRDCWTSRAALPICE